MRRCIDRGGNYSIDSDGGCYWMEQDHGGKPREEEGKVRKGKERKGKGKVR